MLKMQESFVRRLQRALDNKGMTQIELHRMSGINNTTINMYYNGNSLPGINFLTIIAQTLDCNELWLLGYNVPFSRDIIMTEVT